MSQLKHRTMPPLKQKLRFALGNDGENLLVCQAGLYATYCQE